MVVPTCPTVRPGRRAAADRVLDVVPGPQIPERSRMRCAAFVIRHADLVGLVAVDDLCIQPNEPTRFMRDILRSRTPLLPGLPMRRLSVC
ncbi:hypothetical protein CKW46_20810 [Mycobacterium liflandii]|nr:hypothetical protein CKW46_20810 [Mycobacterium liflandii]